VNQEELFEYLEKEKKEVLIELLENAYEVMNREQKDDVFYAIEKKIPLKDIDAENLEVG